MKTNTYDIIIAGAGLSGLSFAYYLATGGYKGSVLLIDKSFAPYNTKTWCFWCKQKPEFYNLVNKEWRKTFFSALDFDAFLYMNKFTYYCIQESDFKEFVLSKLRNYPNFKLLEEGILDFSPGIKKAVLITKDSDTYIADYIFQSVITPESAKSKNLKYPLIQHFYGMEIRTPRPVFDPATFTIMDVDENFDDGFAFIYVLPFKANQALIEYTVFSANPLKKKEYRKKIRTYLKKKFGFTKKDLKVIRKEGGRIPMDDRPFEPQLEQNIFNIGTVGGFTKPSTGYAFSRTHQFTKSLAKSLIENGKPVLPATSARRFRYYDKLLLHILATSAYNSRRTFHHLFKNNSIDLLFDFLNEDTTFSQDLRVMASVPYRPFLQAISKNII